MAVITEELQSKLEQLLVSEKALTSEQLEKYRKAAKTTGTPLLTELLESKTVDSETMTKAIAKVSSVPYVNLTEALISQEILALLPQEIAERYMAVPLGELGEGSSTSRRLAIAMLDANNVQAVDFLANKIQRPLKVYMASEQGIQHVLDQYKTDLEGGVGDAITAATSTDDKSADAKDIESTALVIKQDSPISRALNTILEYAVRARASDIHVEPTENDLRIRCRIDGVLREIMKLPKSIEPALISRIKNFIQFEDRRTSSAARWPVCSSCFF